MAVLGLLWLYLVNLDIALFEFSPLHSFNYVSVL